MNYNVGDKFIVEITDISDSGMGTVYYLDDILTVTDKNIGKLEKYTPVTETAKKPKAKKTHTPEELRDKIFALSALLASTIETYHAITSELNGAGSAIDHALEVDDNG